jgi:hypothetical protein
MMSLLLMEVNRHRLDDWRRGAQRALVLAQPRAHATNKRQSTMGVMVVAWWHPRWGKSRSFGIAWMSEDKPMLAKRRMRRSLP